MMTERHHIFGRAYGDETIDLCDQCHRAVTNWQRTAGIDLRKKVSRSELETLRARLIGLALILELMCRIYGRLISRALDNGGSWEPNPKLDRRGD